MVRSVFAEPWAKSPFVRSDSELSSIRSSFTGPMGDFVHGVCTLYHGMIDIPTSTSILQGNAHPVEPVA